jgi:hypothetical protein
MGAFRLLFVPVFLALPAGPAAAASPRDELLRLVPDDVGFCLVVQDLRGHGAAFLASPFLKQFWESPLGAAVRQAPELKKLDAAEKHLHKHLGIDWPRLRDDVLGDAVAFAYRPGPPGKPEQEQGLVLLRARDATLLADLFERLNQAQKESGDLKELTPREHHGRRYYRRVERNGDNFFYLRGPVLAFSAQEALLLEAIDRDRADPPAGEPPVAGQLRRLGVGDQLAALWVNPRAFLPEMERRAAEAQGADAAVFRAVLAYWRALEGVALTVAVRDDFEAALTVRARPGELPAAARRLFAAGGRPSALWARFPDDALLAATGRVDLPALFDTLGDFLRPEDRRALRDGLERTLGAVLGKDLFRDVLPQLGPDGGVCVTAPPAADRAWFPHAVVALRVQAGGTDQALLAAVNSYALLAVLGYNRHHDDKLTLRSVMQDKTEVKYLENERGFPPGLRPAFALQNGYLVLASSPEAVRRFGAAAEGAGAPASGDVPLLRISFKDLRRFVQERHAPLAQEIAEKNHLSKEDAVKRLDGLLLGLQPLDRLELSQRAADGQVTFTLRVRTALPLK